MSGPLLRCHRRHDLGLVFANPADDTHTRYYYTLVHGLYFCFLDVHIGIRIIHEEGNLIVQICFNLFGEPVLESIFTIANPQHRRSKCHFYIVFLFENLVRQPQAGVVVLPWILENRLDAQLIIELCMVHVFAIGSQYQKQIPRNFIGLLLTKEFIYQREPSDIKVIEIMNIMHNIVRIDLIESDRCIVFYFISLPL